MGVGSSVNKILALPPKDTIVEAYKDATQGIKRIEVNKIMVDFYERNSPFYTPVIGQLYNVGNVSLVRIEIPYKLGWILMDKSIEINKITKETRVKCRQDYPMTLSADRMISNAIIEAMALFPDTEFYIPETINNIPVKQMVIKRNGGADDYLKKALAQMEGTRNLITVIDSMPSDIHITTALLYMLPDMVLAENLTPKKPKGNFMMFMFGGVLFSLITVLLVLYLKI